MSQEKITGGADRMGRFIGQLRDYEGVSLQQLAHGLCAVSYLNKIENGEREIGKQLTDAFFQRLGKPVELFERILDWDEFQQWKQRQEILSHLNNGNVVQARKCAAAYQKIASGVLDQQFLAIIEIDCLALTGASPQETLPLVTAALKLTQPEFETVPIESLLLSQNEARLFFAQLQLREKTEGLTSVAEEYRALLRFFKHPRYESRERVYLLPYVALRVIESDYMVGHFPAALTLCEEILEDLTTEKRLFAYDQLLEWEQRLNDVMGNMDQTPKKILSHLQEILSYTPKPIELLVPCDERGNVYCLNQVIRERRKMLGLSQEELSNGICAPHTLSRIENNGGKIQRKNRRALLKKVHMSGERHDYEVITDNYESYLLRSELDRTMTNKEWNKAKAIFEKLRQQTPDTITNRQYLIKNEAYWKYSLPLDHPTSITLEDRAQSLSEAIKLTLPLDIDGIEAWPICPLSINEMLSLLPLANCYEKMGHHEKCLSVLVFLKKSIECTCDDVSLYESLYGKILISIASVLGSLGRCSESSEAVRKCIEISVRTQHSTELARSLLGEAWNISYGMENLSEEDRKREEQRGICTLQQAYVAALISGDVVRQRSIPVYCRRKYNVELTL